MPREAVLMVANRNVRVASLTGNVIIFKKGEPVRVPARMVQDCMNVGVIPADVDNDNYTPEEEVKAKAPQGLDREDKLREAINTMRDRNERGDFTGAGRPDLRVLGALVGFKPDKAEVEDLWARIREEEGSSLEA